jgi:hypothetical protein
MWLVEAIDRAREKHAFDLWAYVVMPELNGNSRRI